MTDYAYPVARVLDWHDGDTAHVDVDLGFGQRAAAYDLKGRPQLSARVYGINAPELGTTAGAAALDYARTLCPAGTLITLISHGWDKYGGRFDATLTLPDGTDYATRMLAAGHATPL